MSARCCQIVVAIVLALITRHQLAASEPPNVVMILADDQSYRDFGFLGNDVVHTPNIDRLARQSARYPNGYVPMSVCRPSLATLLTGLYPHQHGIHFNHPPPGLRLMRKMTAQDYRTTRGTTDALIRDVPTLPRILARHGYACLQTGKHWESAPFERNNLIANQGQSVLVARLRSLLDGWWSAETSGVNQRRSP